MAGATNPKSVAKTNELATCAHNARTGGEGMRAADRKTREAHVEWIESALLAAGALHTARRKLKHDAAFGDWCEANDCGFDLFSKDERAALVRIGADLSHWRNVLGKTESRSLRLIVQKEPSPEVSQAAILPPRHKTKPGPKAKAAEQVELAKRAPEHVLRAADRAEALSRERVEAASRAARNAAPPTLAPEVLEPRIEYETLPNTAEDLAAGFARLKEEHEQLTLL
jgi:hypothetical protein